MILKKMIINNFKGIKRLEIEVRELTEIYGDNKTGKTTIKDAFMWVMFGKNSEDKTVFSVKPTDKNGETKKDIEVDVTVIFDTISLRKTLHENWEKKRGSEIQILKGNITECYVNNVPLNVSSYAKQIADIIDERMFKLITDPLYFNTKIKWEDRRSMLISLVGDVDISEFASTEDRKNLILEINKSASLSAYKKSILTLKKKVKDSLDLLPGRIDEVNRQIPVNEEEYAFADTDKGIAEKAIIAIDNQIAGNNSDELTKLNSKIAKLNNLIVSEEEKVTTSDRDAKTAIENARIALIKCKESMIENLENTKKKEIKLVEENKNITQLRKEYNEVSQREENTSEVTDKCAACGQSLPKDEVEAALTKYKTDFFKASSALTW